MNEARRQMNKAKKIAEEFHFFRQTYAKEYKNLSWIWPK